MEGVVVRDEEGRSVVDRWLVSAEMFFLTPVVNAQRPRRERWKSPAGPHCEGPSFADLGGAIAGWLIV